MSGRPTLPLLEALAHATPATLKADLVAGLTTAIMLVPQAMAYALLAGLDPIVGLYASILPTAVYALFGTSPVLSVGPVAMDSLLVAGAVAPLAGDDPVAYALYASALAAMVGTLQLGLGITKMGRLVRYLKAPMMAGFTAAAAIIIAASQLTHAMGIRMPRSGSFVGQVRGILSRLGEVDPVTCAISAGSILVLVLLKRLWPAFPRFVAVVVAGTLLTSLLGLDALGVTTVGVVPSGLPSFRLPVVQASHMAELGFASLALALVGVMEATAISQVYAKRQGHVVRTNQELLALGASNVAGSLFQAYPVSGGFSRTAVNVQAGARSNLAGLVTAVLVGVSVMFLTPLFEDLPKAVLASIILSAVVGLIDVKEFRHLWRDDKPHFGLAVLTFVATLFLGIVQGIGVGIVASLILDAVLKRRG